MPKSDRSSAGKPSGGRRGARRRLLAAALMAPFVSVRGQCAFDVVADFQPVAMIGASIVLLS